MPAGRTPALLTAALMALAAGACSSIGPSTVSRDRIDYETAIGDSWKQQTLLNIVKLRYGDFPVFMEIAQVIAGYQLQTTVAAGFSAQNYITSSVGGPAAIGGTAGVGATYIDRPTLIYAPLTGTDFLKKLMTPVPPSAVLFLLQSGYDAGLVLQIAVDSINGVRNESRRGAMARSADPQFVRLGQLLRDLQIASALQLRIERGKNGAETTGVFFPSVNETAEVAAKIAEVRSILHIRPGLRQYSINYGGYSGKADDISMLTRSMLQIMLELGVLAQVPEADIAAGRATPPGGSVQAAGGERPPLLNISSGTSRPPDAYAAIEYKGRWFWIADTDVRSKTIFTSVMLLFSIAEVGVRAAAPVVTVPAN
jgi:hypothetical protein